MTDIVIVPYTEDARAFVYDSFVRSWVDAANGGNDAAPVNELAQMLFQVSAFNLPVLHRYLDKVLARSTTYIASAAELPNVYIGWMAANADTLEYVYVKRAARRLGIARDLMKHHGTPLTRQAMITWPWTERLTK